jgi:hypothetical protein
MVIDPTNYGLSKFKYKELSPAILYNCMFNHELIKKTSEQASQFKMPYLVPPSTEPCNYCQLLKKYPNLSGTHVNGCVNKKRSDQWNAIKDKPGCHYCNKLEIFPGLVGMHSVDCKKRYPFLMDDD